MNVVNLVIWWLDCALIGAWFSTELPRSDWWISGVFCVALYLFFSSFGAFHV